MFDYILSLFREKKDAWDVGTGNGQVARILSNHFKCVHATDISEAQLANAFTADNILYSKQPAEKSSFPDQCFDLVIVAQAIHWFRFDDFYKEVKRTLKPDGKFVVIGYNLIKTHTPPDITIDKLYREILGNFWDKERRYIDDNYTTIPFPFREITTPFFNNHFSWNIDQLIGYFETWSAVQHYKTARNENPVDLIKSELENIWGNETSIKIEYPLIVRVGCV